VIELRRITGKTRIYHTTNETVKYLNEINEKIIVRGEWEAYKPHDTEQNF
jgi:hypothetical protein